MKATVRYQHGSYRELIEVEVGDNDCEFEIITKAKNEHCLATGIYEKRECYKVVKVGKK